MYLCSCVRIDLVPTLHDLVDSNPLALLLGGRLRERDS